MHHFLRLIRSSRETLTLRSANPGNNGQEKHDIKDTYGTKDTYDIKDIPDT
jgi:hypothetical protein